MDSPVQTIYILYQDDDTNPLINTLGMYILDKLSTFQNMQEYLVTAETDIDECVSEFTILHDWTKIYCFSKKRLRGEVCCFFSMLQAG